MLHFFVLFKAKFINFAIFFVILQQKYIQYSFLLSFKNSIMFGLDGSYYYIIMALQAFCMYHAYKNGTHQKWFFFILFIPFIGCLIYLYDNFYSRKNVDNLAEGVKELVYSNYTVSKLEKEVKYSETIANKMNLADAYTERGRFDEALTLYNSCKNGFYENDPGLLRKMLLCYFQKKDYGQVIDLGTKLENVKSIALTDDKVAYAWALHFMGDTDKAEEKFKGMNAKFTNFEARIEFSKFYKSLDKFDEAKQILKAIIDEFEGMSSYERSAKKSIVRDAKRVLQTIK